MNKIFKFFTDYILGILTYIGFILLIIYLLSSCRTAQRHIEIALKKDPNIILCDTVKKVEVITQEVFKTLGHDSIIIDNKRIFLKVYGQGKLDLFYVLKSDSIEYNDIKPIIKPSLKSRDIKQQEKTKRTVARQENKTARVVTKYITKYKIKTEKRKWWDNFKVGFISSFLIVLLIFFIKNRNNANNS